MGKIIFFDIDGTLFDVSVFLSELFKKLEKLTTQTLDLETFQSIYDDSKKEKGYFTPEVFIKLVSMQFSISKEKTWEVFQDVDLFQKSMYKDTLVIKDLSDKALIGIFSKGDREFQKKKLSFINFLFDRLHIYVFPNKIDKAREVFGKYKNHEIYLVDDNLEVLEKIGNLLKINLILIDRNNYYNSDKRFTKIKNLSELKSII